MPILGDIIYLRWILSIIMKLSPVFYAYIITMSNIKKWNIVKLIIVIVFVLYILVERKWKTIE